MANTNVEIIVLDPRALIPTRATEESAGVDLRALLDAPMVIQPGTNAVLINTGLAIHVPEGYAALILPRSGLGHKKGLVLGNLVGLIDGDYQGELFISAWNRSNDPICIECFERIAQLTIVPVLPFTLTPVKRFSKYTERGAGGFGHTGSL